MASCSLPLYLLLTTALVTFVAFSDVSGESKLHKILKKNEVLAETKPEGMSLPPNKAKEFLAALKRPKRNLWDRNRPDVQQWIMQFMYMGFDEARLESDLAYWKDQYQANDQGRQHHYDENAPMGPRYPNAYRHGANINYDYY